MLPRTPFNWCSSVLTGTADRLRDIIRRSPVLMTVALIAMLLQTSVGTAQENPPARPDDAAKVDLQSLAPGYYLLHKKTGAEPAQLVPDVSPEILQNVHERLALQKRSEVFDLQVLEVDARVEGDLIWLSADLQVEVEVDEEWVRVPIGFADFYLTDLKHTTEALNGRGQFEKEELPKKNWLLYGRGQHRLMLQMVGRVQPATGNKQILRLSAPRATKSHLLLTSQQLIESVDMSPAQPFLLRRDELRETSVIETWGLQPELELTWQPETIAQDEAVTIQSAGVSTMLLDLTDPSMSVTQPLTVSGGSISRLHVQLPEEFLVSSVEVADSESQTTVEPVTAQEPGRIEVRFSEPVTGAVTLRYNLSLSSSTYPQNIRIRPPVVEGVADQAAEVNIFVPVGLEVEVGQLDVSRVQEKRVESTGRQRTPAVAYRLLSDDAQLDLTVSETEAFYSVSPLISLETERNTILLTARFEVNMIRGSLNEMDVRWQGYRREGWTILDVQMTPADSDTEVPVGRSAAPNNNDGFRIGFPGRQSGLFQVEVQAARDLASFQDGEGIFFLPNIDSPTPHTTTVVLIESDSYSMSLAARDEQASFPSLPASRLPEDFLNRRASLSAWLVDSPDAAVELAITPQQSEIRTRILTELTPATGHIHVRETISFDVFHRDLAEITLIVPDVTLMVRLEDNPDQLERTVVDAKTVTYALPEKLRGSFQVFVDYLWAPDADVIDESGTEIQVPVVLPRESDQLQNMTVVTNTPQSFALQPGRTWERIYFDQYAAAWTHDGRVDSIPISLIHPLRRDPDVSPLFAVLRTVPRGNTLVTSLSAVFPQHTDTVLVSVDSNCVNPEAYFDDQQADVDEIARDAGRTTYQLRRRPTENSNGPSTVILIVQQPFTSQHGLFSTCRLTSPRIVGADPQMNKAWIISQAADGTVFRFGSSINTIDDLRLPTAGEESAPMSGTLAALVSPYDSESQQLVRTLLTASPPATGDVALLMNSLEGNTHTLVAVPRRTQLLIAALVGLITYFVFLQLRAVPLITIVVVAATACTALIAVVPPPVHDLLRRLAPGTLLAIMAALLQRYYGRSVTPHPTGLSSPDQSTIFAIEHPSEQKPQPVQPDFAPTVITTPQ